MKPALAMLALATALSTTLFGALSAQPISAAVMGLPGKSDAATPAVVTPAVATFDDARLFLIDSDDDEGDDDEGDDDDSRGHDDDDDDCEGDDDDDNEGDCGNGKGKAKNPARAGKAKPPANGLFNNGAAPKVQMN